MKTYVSPGVVMSFAAPYAVLAGGGFLVGSLFAVAVNAADNGAAVEGQTVGIYTLAKATGEAWTVGAKLYWDNTNKRLTTTATSNTLVGCAAAAAASGDTTGNARIDGVVR